MKLIIKIFLITLLVLTNCVRENKKSKLLVNDQPVSIKSIPQNDLSNFSKDEPVSNCPDSAITYSNYSRYYSKDLGIDKAILIEFNITNEKLVKSLEKLIEIEERISTLKIYQLFTRKSDNQDILIKKGAAKHLYGESPYDQEYYLFQGDTIQGDSQSPTYYYYDDTLRVIETCRYDNVEGCDFSREVKYFRDGKLSLAREYHFYLTCWEKTNKDSLNGFIRDGNFRETYNFFNDKFKDEYKRELNFYRCKESALDSKYIVERIYEKKFGQEATIENTDLEKYE